MISVAVGCKNFFRFAMFVFQGVTYMFFIANSNLELQAQANAPSALHCLLTFKLELTKFSNFY